MSSTTGHALERAGLGGTTLPFSGGIEDIVVDDARERVFISGGTGESKVVAIDFTGKILAKLDIPDAQQMAFDGQTLYVASPALDAIARVDATTDPPSLDPDGPLSVSPYADPGGMALIDDHLWVSVSSGPAVVVMGTDGSGLTEAIPEWGGQMAVAEGHSDLLLYGTIGVSNYAASQVPATLLWNEEPLSGIGHTHQVAVEPSNQRFVVAASSPYGFQEFRMADADKTRFYRADAYPSAVDVTRARSGLIVGGIQGYTDPDVWVYRIGNTRPIWTYDFPDVDTVVAPGGVAWSGDGARVFVVTGEDQVAKAPVFHVMYPFAKTTSLRIQARPTPVDFGAAAVVTATLNGGASNRKVRIYARVNGGPRTMIRAGDVGADDRLSVRVRPRVNTTYSVEYDGEVRWTPAGDSMTLGVRMRLRAHLEGYVGSSGGYKLYRRGGRMELPLHVSPDHSGRVVKAALQASNGGPWTGVGGGDLRLNGSSDGVFFLRHVPGGVDLRIKAWIPRDHDHLGDETDWFYFRAVGARASRPFARVVPVLSA